MLEQKRRRLTQELDEGTPTYHTSLTGKRTSLRALTREAEENKERKRRKT